MNFIIHKGGEMNANELRIGNRVQGISIGRSIELPNGINYKIVELLAFTCKVVREDEIPATVEKWLEFSYSLLAPIPLTPEILERCGWVWNQECDSFEKYPNGDARMNLQYRSVNSSFTMFNYVLKALIADKIYYLHQLQNLVFALTGKELEIK